jgi:hypothetical protein
LSSIPTGSYQASNGSGGPDVGPFTVSFTAQTPSFSWSNQSVAAATIDRTKPLIIQWTGGDPAGLVLVNLDGEYIYGTQGSQVSISCAASVSAGQLTIPPSALLNFFGTDSNAAFSSNNIAVYGYSAFQLLAVPDMDLVVAATQSGANVASATFK